MNGTWSDQATPFPPTLRNGTSTSGTITNGDHKPSQDPILKTCTFTIGETKPDGFIRDFKAQMNGQGWTVSVTVKSGTVFSIAGSRNGLVTEAATGKDFTSSIVTALQGCIKDSTLPAKEGWDIS